MRKNSFYFSGFTLIELIITIVLLGGLTASGLAAYTTYAMRLQLNTTSLNIANEFQLARSRAQSQAILTTLSCLDGYVVVICQNSATYCYGGFPSNSFGIVGWCNKNVPQWSSPIDQKLLPVGVTFVTGNAAYLFPTLSGGIGNTQSIIITKAGKQQVLSISPSGSILISPIQ